MRVRLLKSYQHSLRKFPKGFVLTVHDPRKMIADGVAEEYTGEYPPKKKMKTSFKPKIN